MKMHLASALLAPTILFSSTVFAQTTNDTSSESEAPVALTPEQVEEQEYLAWAQSFTESLTPISGDVKLPGGKASLNVPDDYYYLSPQDTKRVLEEAWGNPEGPLMLGMLFPKQYSVLDAASWGVTLQYVDDGYVSDEDAQDINYDDLLQDMQQDTRDANEWRAEQGYEPIQLVGWAEKPYYDVGSHKLYWAKELKFGDSAQNTLNYNVRALGRQGYLEMNFIASMNQLEEVNLARDTVLAMASFDAGHKYSEFDPEIDNVAAYGIGGLIAGKVLAKTGFFAIALVFLKKFWFILLLPLVWLKGKLFPKKAEA